MRKLWVYPYKTGSEMAKMLAEYCGALQIKRENSEFHGQKGQFIMNWGGGTGNFRADVGKATVLNPPELIDKSIDKIRYFNTMNDPRGPRCPFWTTDSRVAQQWLEAGNTVLARQEACGARGEGIVVMKKPLDFVYAPLYTIKVDNVVHEYRVYMFNDEVVDYRIKEGKKKNDCFIGIDAEFTIPDTAIPKDVELQAKKAQKLLPLTIQGLDILWDGERAWVLETNTAPWLGTRIAARYARKLHELVEKAA